MDGVKYSKSPNLKQNPLQMLEDFSSTSAAGSIGSTEYKCDCGLLTVVRTSFTYQNMGMRFRLCPKTTGQCKFFHFLPGEERIEGKARELLLILKDKEGRQFMAKESVQNENGVLQLENGKLLEENRNLMKENANLLQENEQLKAQSRLMDRKIRFLEKKLEKVEMRSSQAVLMTQCSFIFLIIICVTVAVFLLRKISN